MSGTTAGWLKACFTTASTFKYGNMICEFETIVALQRCLGEGECLSTYKNTSSMYLSKTKLLGSLLTDKVLERFDKQDLNEAAY